jgi:hypothetical protein
VNGDLVTFDILQDSFVGRRFSSGVVFGGESVDRNAQGEAFDLCPFQWNGPDSTGNELDSDSARFQAGEDLIQLAKPNERLPTHNRNVQGLVSIHKFHELSYELRSFKIAHLIQENSADVVLAIRIATRTAEWAFLGDFYREERRSPCEDSLPTGQNLARFHT